MSKQTNIDDMCALDYVNEIACIKRNPALFLKYCQILTSERISKVQTVLLAKRTNYKIQ